MFERPGKIIKIVAIIHFWIICIFGTIGGVLFATIVEMDASYIIGLGIALASVFVAYISSLFIYSYGQFVDNSDTIVEQNDSIIYLLQNRDSNAPNDPIEKKYENYEKVNSVNYVVCPSCKSTQEPNQQYCSNCGAKLY